MRSDKQSDTFFEEVMKMKICLQGPVNHAWSLLGHESKLPRYRKPWQKKYDHPGFAAVCLNQYVLRTCYGWFNQQYRRAISNIN
jgi:hypothetical protein